MRLTICARDCDEMNRFIAALETELRSRCAAVSLRRFRTKRDLLYDMEDGVRADVVLLGIVSAEWVEETMTRLKDIGTDSAVVLLAPDERYAVHGYDWGASGYWLTSISPAEAADRLERLLQHRQTHCMTVRTHSEVRRVPFSKITYVESNNAKCFIHLTDGTVYTMYTRLDALEEQAKDARFLRCHQSFLVNMDHIASADKAFILTDGSVVSVRQREWRRFRDHYLAYIDRRVPLKESDSVPMR